MHASGDISPILPADPQAQYLAHKTAIDDAISRVLSHGHYILGDEVSAFEREFAQYLGMSHAVGVGSGTDALQLALRSLGIGPGHSVITVAHTAVATIAAIEMAGATPVLVDIDPISYTMSPAALAHAIAHHQGGPLKAVIPVHLYGHPADMSALLAIARQHSLAIIEDCAQAHGAAIGDRLVGTFGDCAAFSFYPTKNLGALGDAGALVCGNEELATRARQLRQYGWKERYISEYAGINTRLDEIQAAILRVKLPHLNDDNQRRRLIASQYNQGLADTGLTLPTVPHNYTHAYHQYTILCQDRDALASHLKSQGITPALLYPAAIHQQPAYQARRFKDQQDLSVSERICSTLLCLPIHSKLADDQVQCVIDVVRQYARVFN